MKNIQFKFIEITNFLSVGKTQRIDFSDGITSIFGVNHDRSNDTNGIGKSTIFSAICFALYGDPIKDIKRDEVVNRIAGGKCEVRISFDVIENGSAVSYDVIRGVKPSFCKLIRDGNDISLSGMPETTKQISDVIGTTAVMFKNTCLMSLEDNVPFARQKAAEKREFIEGVFDLGFIKDMAKMAKASTDKYMSENTEAVSRIDEVRNQISVFRKGEADFETDRKERIHSMQERIDSLDKECLEMTAKIVAVSESEIESLKKEMDSLASDEKRVDLEYRRLNEEKLAIVKEGTETKARVELLEQRTEDHHKKRLEIEHLADEYGIDDVNKFVLQETYDQNEVVVSSCEKKLFEVSNAKSDLKAKTMKCKQDIDALRKFGNICVACGRPFSDSDLSQRDLKIHSIENDMKDCLNKLQKLDSVENRIKARIEEGREIRNRWKVLSRMDADYSSFQFVDTTELKNKIAGLRQKVLDNASAMKQNVFEKDRLSKKRDDLLERKRELDDRKSINDSLNDRISFKTKEVYRITEEMNVLKDSENKFSSYISESEARLSELEKKRDETEHLCDVYGAIRTILSDDGFRSYMVKQYISVLNNQINGYLKDLDSPITLEFDEYLDDRIIDQLTGDACSYASLSGGEKRRVDIACLLAFSDLRKLRGDVLFSHAFYDEILDSALSPMACSKLMGLLKNRFDEFGESAMIVTHKQEMQDDPNISHRIMVEKIGGVSKFKNE